MITWRVSREFLLLLACWQLGCVASYKAPDGNIPTQDASSLKYFQLAQEQASKERFVEAELLLRRALRDNPTAEPLLYSLGVIHEKLKDYKGAEAIFKALPDSVRKTTALNRFAIRRLERGAISSLEDDYNKAVQSGDVTRVEKKALALASVKEELGALTTASCLQYEAKQY